MPYLNRLEVGGTDLHELVSIIAGVEGSQHLAGTLGALLEVPILPIFDCISALL